MNEPRVDNRKIRKQQIVRFVLKESLTAGGDAEAYVRLCRTDGTFYNTTEVIQVYDTDGDLDGSAGDKGKAAFMPDSGHYEILSLVC